MDEGLMSKFKYGDIVRCIAETHPKAAYRKGECYEVLDTYSDGKRIHTVLDSNGSTTNGWAAEHFELVAPKRARVFTTGALRDLDEGKLDFDGFLSPLVMERFAQHMHAARKMPDGTMRESDNWQLGIKTDVYMKSMWRHFFAVWKTHRGWDTDDIEAELCALIFNASGMLHEILKAKNNG